MPNIMLMGFALVIRTSIALELFSVATLVGMLPASVSDFYTMGSALRETVPSEQTTVSTGA